MTSFPHSSSSTDEAWETRELAQLRGTVYAFRVDADGTPSFPFVSQACTDLYGFTAEEAMADVTLMHQAVHSHDQRRFNEAGQHSLRTLQPMRWEGRIMRTDGREVAVVVNSQPRRDEAGNTEWVGVVTQQADSAIAPTTASSRDAALSDVQSDAIAMLGHDVAGPLTVIVASAEFALDELTETSPRPSAHVDGTALERRLRTILKQAQRLSDLRDDLLATAAADAHVIRAEPVTADVLPYLRAAADVEGTAAKLVVDCPSDLYCRVQPSHLTQMLTNLVGNALRYAASEVTLTASPAGSRVLITVRDDGPGVPPEVTARLFRRFSHAGMSARPPGAGSGLGLYIVRTLATANQGTVLYTPGKQGARFTIALPGARPFSGDSSS
ncbi:PAS domain-containing sensor histidine kinase [Nocardioides sp. zg-1308]|uniref:histidine kinase n=1 Tax=Nocardioides renjunii TaxID=3095075 RepID=A0ABU5KBF7_9ACTN|nr:MULTISPECIES: PAS domain-containing sensor histidine kinase [unclassified Nocardioides]MDZ5662308.1 PAS domain-containing sensor histidine kinase [Nocardioides sp. S-58]NPD05995.1 PAS domain-containing sensor histidine kinase [Nocardioides sp. zg-1308]WQQ20474.1 PAS domain-containing sensor histidine kinase [Nocardioides sp. S-34]